MRHEETGHTLKDRGGLHGYRIRSTGNPFTIPLRHTGKTRKARETREPAEKTAGTPVSSALRREYNFHSTGSEIVQPVDATKKLPHNYDAAAGAAVLHGNFFADLSVSCRKEA
jgi:hypothetical protein